MMKVGGGYMTSKTRIPYQIIDTLTQYEHLLELGTTSKREDYFRYEIMGEIKVMWELLNVPLKPSKKNGYDILMATQMLGYLSLDNDKLIEESIKKLRKAGVLTSIENTLIKCLEKAENADLRINANELKLGLYLADPEQTKQYHGFSGFGGIPGFITLNIFPNCYNLSRIEGVIAHEFHHNLRFSYMSWDHGNVTVGDYLVIEGLAESFALELYGAEQLGPWVTTLDSDDLEYSLYVIGEALDTKGFSEVSSYMFGDEIAKQQGYQPVGLSFCAGYAIGFEVVQAFLKKKNKTIYEATLLSSKEILKGSGLFSDYFN